MRRIHLLTAALLLSTLAATSLAETFSWQQPHAEVLPTGNLKWKPRAFVFEHGEVVRYIDYQAGDDDNPGTRAKPWKHHPWDANATGQAKAANGPATYVFKRGVIYRGYMRSPESGRKGDPIRLTSDPDWGTGEAMIYGSARITDGWKKCTPADAPGIPEPEKVWYIDLGDSFDRDRKGAQLSAIWRLKGDKAVRIHIARDPNWTITNPDDPTGNWYRWDAFLGHSNRGWLADDDLKGKDPSFFDGGHVWTQHRNLMGSVHKVTIQEYDPDRGAFKIGSPGGATYRRGGNPRSWYNLGGRVRYYIEDVRAYLDHPGEYYYDTEKARLFIRLDDDSDPNQAVLELAQVRSPIAIFDQSHIEVSGLTFRFNDDDDGLYGYPWQISASPCVRIVGNSRDITVRNCKFYDVMNAVVAFPRPRGGEGGPPKASEPDVGKFANDYMADIFITDNDVRNADMAGAIWAVGNSERTRGEPYGVLNHVEVMRNRVINTGFRPGKSPTSSIPAISVVLPITAEIAGNIVDTSWGNGVFTLGGKSSGSVNDVPLARMLIHHNQIDNTMLGCNDYGGLELFQGGPAYIYNNISRNAVGTKTFVNHELAYNLYLDGAFKVYSFNNILAGKIKPDNPDYHGHCGYFMVFGFLDHLFNNTIYHFEYGLNGSSGNRSCILGNVMADCSKSFMGQNRPGDVSMEFGGDTGEMGRKGIPTMVYGNNVFYGKPQGGYRNGQGSFGFVGGTSSTSSRGAQVYAGDTLEQLSKALTDMKARVSSIGKHVKTMPLRDPANRDYRPIADSGAKDMGVKFFVPWGLSRMVGEWNFYKSPYAPKVVLGENFYMQDEHMHRSMYYFVPRHDLTVNQADPEDYVEGPLEDWIPGALRFDGKSRFAVLTHKEMSRDMTYPYGVGASGRVRSGRSVFKGADRETLDMSDNNFLVEIYFRADKDHTDGGLVGKTDGRSGYALGFDSAGRIVLTVQAAGHMGGRIAGPKLADGKWHHVIAEVDRKAGLAALYVDGEVAARANLPLMPTASLSNQADFLVGKSHDGKFFAGAVDFLRVSRGTLAEARTTIEELYEWQFNGPHLHDFTGVKPVGRRDAGAIEGR